MYEFFINTDSRTLSSVEIYADSEKGTRLNSPLDAVERFAQDVRIGFIGSAVPAADDAVKLVVAWDGVTDSVLEAQTGGATRFFIETVGARGADGRWAFKVNFASVALEEAFRAKTRLTLRAAVVVENATAATHVEYQFTLSGAASIFSGAARDPQTATIAFAKVIRLSWAEYQALPEIDAEALYVCADAPSDVEAHDADADAHAAAFERRLSGYVTEDFLAGGFSTQAIFGADAMTGAATNNSVALDGATLLLISGGAEVNVRAQAGTVALLSDLEEVSRGVSTNAENLATLSESFTAFAEGVQLSVADLSIALQKKASLQTNNPGTPNNNANGYGYVGTLRNLGAWGGSVIVEKLSLWRRANVGGATGSVYARILKISAEGTAWVIAAQSKNAVDIGSVAFSGEMSFSMAGVPGVTPPSADEKIAIVFVADAGASAGTSDGAIGFRTVDGAGALANALPATPPAPSGQSGYRPMIGLSFAPAADSPSADASLSARLDAIEARVAALEGA